MLRTITHQLKSKSSNFFSSISNSKAKTYGPLCTKFYELDKPEPDPETLAFLESVQSTSPGPILEPMCGTGRYLLPFAKKGHDTTGFDSSRDMISLFRAKCANLATQPNIHLANFQSFAPSRTYSFCFIPAGSFELISCSSVANQALRQLSNFLSNRGKLVLEMTNPELVQSEDMNVHSRIVSDQNSAINLTTKKQFDKDDSTLRTSCYYREYRCAQLLNEESEVITQKIWDPKKLQLALEAVNIELITLDATPTSKLQQKKQMLVYTFQKRD